MAGVRWSMGSSWLGRATLPARASDIGPALPFLDGYLRLDGVQPRLRVPGPSAGTAQGEARPHGARWNPLRVLISDIDWSP